MAVGQTAPVDPGDRLWRRILELERAVEDLQRLSARAPKLPVYATAAARDAALPAPQRGMVVLVGSALTVHNGTSWVTV